MWAILRLIVHFFCQTIEKLLQFTFSKAKFFAKFFKAVLLLTVNPIETLIVDSETKRKRVKEGPIKTDEI